MRCGQAVGFTSTDQNGAATRSCRGAPSRTLPKCSLLRCDRPVYTVPVPVPYFNGIRL